MTDQTDDAHDDAHVPTRDRTFRPFGIPDRITRRTRDDHATNAALHDALDAARDPEDHTVSYDLMASHAPGEKDHEPRYHVRVSIRNHGGGDANVHDTPVGRLLDRGKIDVVDVWSGSSWSIEEGDVDSVDDVHDVMRDYHADRLELQIRPVETRVEPVEVKYGDLPSDVFTFDVLKGNAARVLTHAIDEVGSNPRTYEAARVLATLLYIVDPDTNERSFNPDEEDPLRWINWLTDHSEAGWHFNQTADGLFVEYDTDGHRANGWEDYHAVSYEGGDGHTKTIEVSSVDTKADAVAAARRVLDTFDVDHPVAPTGYASTDANGVPYEDAVGTGACDAEDASATDSTSSDTDGVTGATDALEGFEPYTTRRARRHDVDVAIQDRDDGSIVAKVEGEKAGEWHKVDTGRGIYNVRVDVDDDRTSIPCGCGDYDVMVPSGTSPEAIDVVCPECGNHFGHGGTDE